MGSPYEALLRPLTIKGLTIRNRIMSTSHAPSYGDAGRPKDRYQLYHAEKAKGGIGLTMFGGSSSVSPDSPASPWNQISVADDGVIPYFQEFAARVHGHGAALMIQLTHMGRRTRWDTENWLPTVSPSPVREPASRSIPKQLERWDMERIIADYVSAVRRCREGGLDGCEISAAHGHLLDQFWSPSVNRRTDEYGGSLENRMRFGMEVFEAIRRDVGEDYIVGIRMSADELIDDGLSFEDCLTIAKTLSQAGLVDFVDLLGGQARDHMAHAIILPNMAFPVAPFLPLVSAFRAELDVPVFHAQRIMDLATASRAVADGHVDMVAMTRAHIADPHIVNKLMADKADDIRQCVGAGYCIDRIYAGKDALCIQNASTGREATLPHDVARADTHLKTVVIGAGPAGLEAARVLALRGHEVVLIEREALAGGQLLTASKATWREALTGITRWLVQQVQKLGVDLRLGTEATVETILAEAPDIVVVATGGYPSDGWIKGAELAQNTWEILNGSVEPAETVLIYDGLGQHQAVSCAEVMAKRGAKVELVTLDRAVGEEVGGTNFPVHLRELYRLDVIMTPNLTLTEIYGEGNKRVAVLRNDYTLEEEERLVDQIVLEFGTLPNDALYFALREQSANKGKLDLEALIDGRPQMASSTEGQFALYRIGDAVAGRNVHAAIYDAKRLCRVL
ncbi:MAG: FAD-dependent oxidoreductase [Hyphomonadaceae bacterium]|nr:FAD-dependent oxidoreductase [Hyphomonadaceae bacterium]